MEAITVVLALALIVALVALLAATRRPASGPLFEAGRIVEQLQSLQAQLAPLPGIRSHLDVDGRLREEMSRRIEETQRAIDALRLQAEERRRRDEDLVATTRRIEAVFAGSAGRGRAGERALAEALQAFPQDMVVRDLVINGRVVEFALRLADGRMLPIDSKWPAAELLAGLEEGRAGDGVEVARAVEKEVGRRIREVAQYVMPGHTTPYALAALPDAVLACCTTAYREAQRRGVLLMSYSMAVPYLLALYRLHIEYSGSVDMDRARARLADVGRGLEDLDAVLEQRLARAATMAQNAYFEAKQITARLRAAVSAVELGDVA